MKPTQFTYSTHTEINPGSTTLCGQCRGLRTQVYVERAYMCAVFLQDLKSVGNEYVERCPLCLEAEKAQIQAQLETNFQIDTLRSAIAAIAQAGYALTEWPPKYVAVPEQERWVNFWNTIAEAKKLIYQPQSSAPDASQIVKQESKMNGKTKAMSKAISQDELSPTFMSAISLAKELNAMANEATAAINHAEHELAVADVGVEAEVIRDGLFICYRKIDRVWRFGWAPADAEILNATSQPLSAAPSALAPGALLNAPREIRIRAARYLPDLGEEIIRVLDVRLAALKHINAELDAK
ncbi:MAG: hypothetical protein WC551_08570 [Patescibacteria group bacterium]